MMVLAVAVVPPPFLNSIVLFSIKATAMSNCSAVTYILVKFHTWFQKVAHLKEKDILLFPYLIIYSIFTLLLAGSGQRWIC